MPHVTVNETNLYYEIRRSGPPVLLIMGATGDGGHFDTLAGLLASEFTVITYDRRGNGRSPVPPHWHTTSPAEQADDAAALLRALDVGPAMVFGTSSGGNFALCLLARHPELVRGVILHEPGLYGLLDDLDAVRAPVRALVEEAMATARPSTAVERFWRHMAGDRGWDHLPAALRKRMRDGATTLLRVELGTYEQYLPDDEALAATEVPVHLLVSEDSLPVFAEIAARLSARLAVEVTTTPGGHAAYHDRPHELARAIRSSLRAIDTDTADDCRFDARSEDGTALAVWVDGTGPALVMVHGSMADHTTFDPFVDALRDSLTTFAMDRRGFGASGDPAPAGYSIEREFEDVAAVVDAVAARTGGPVALWGHSYGASCAMGGAALTANVHHLVLYEPSLGIPYPPGSIDAIEAALARGDNDGAIEAVLVGILDMTEDEIDAFRSNPLWPVRLATAPTIPRECRVEDGWHYQAGQFGSITAPTLLLTGSDSVPAVTRATHHAAAAIPHAQIHVLDGHGHFAHKTDPHKVATLLHAFIDPDP